MDWNLEVFGKFEDGFALTFVELEDSVLFKFADFEDSIPFKFPKFNLSESFLDVPFSFSDPDFTFKDILLPSDAEVPVNVQGVDLNLDEDFPVLAFDVGLRMSVRTSTLWLKFCLEGGG